jgi:hypothetical protein
MINTKFSSKTLLKPVNKLMITLQKYKQLTNQFKI